MYVFQLVKLKKAVFSFHFESEIENLTNTKFYLKE